MDGFNNLVYEIFSVSMILLFHGKSNEMATDIGIFTFNLIKSIHIFSLKKSHYKKGEYFSMEYRQNIFAK
jgi:hypothetical protein